MGSGIFQTYVEGALRPKMICIQYRDDLIHGPSGWNLILYSGSSAVASLPGGAAAIPTYPSGTLNFGSGLTPVITDPWITDTIPFLFAPKADPDNPIVSENVSIFNMKLWVENTSAFTDAGLSPYIQILPSGKWRRNLVLTSGYAGAFEVPTSLPSGQNIYRNDGEPFLSGIGQLQRTQTIYSSMIWQSGTYPVGHYGGLASGTFKFRFTYDWTARDAVLKDGDY